MLYRLLHLLSEGIVLLVDGWEQLLSLWRMWVDGVQDHRKNSDLQKAAEIKINEKYEHKSRKQNPGHYEGDSLGLHRL